MEILNHYKTWSKEEEEFMKKNYVKTRTEVLMKVLGRTRNSILTKASAMGLRKEGYENRPFNNRYTKPKAVKAVELPEFLWKEIKKPELKVEKKNNTNEFILFVLLIANLIAITVDIVLKAL